MQIDPDSGLATDRKSGTPVPHRRSTSKAAATSLPTLEGQPWFDRLYGDVLISAEFDKHGTLTLHSYYKELPNQYLADFMDGLADPVVQAELRTFKDRGEPVVIRVLKATDAPGEPAYDDGRFTRRDYDSKHRKWYPAMIDINVTGSASSNTLQNEFSLRALMVHEALHAVNDVWYTYIENPKNIPPGMKKKLDRIQSTCFAIVDPTYQSFLERNRTKIAEVFVETARDVENSGMKPHQTRRTAQALRAAASAVLNNDPAIKKLSHKYGCNMPDLFQVAEAAAHTNGNGPLWTYIYEIPDAYSYFREANEQTNTILGKPFLCVAEQTPLSKLRRPGQPKLVIGHPGGNSSEMGSSFEVSTKYLPPTATNACLADIAPSLARRLRDYGDAVWDATVTYNPRVAEALGTAQKENKKALENFGI